MIFSFIQLKGGVGKSSLALHLSHLLALSGKSVLLVDADPQGSVSDWANVRESAPPFTIVGMARDTIHRDLPPLSKGYSYTVIDTPPRVATISRSAMLASDVILVPLSPSSFDAFAVDTTSKIIEEAQVFKPDLKVFFVLNRVVGKSQIGRDIKDLLKDYPYPLLSTAIQQRVIVAEAASGATVFELTHDPQNKAVLEFKALGRDLQKALGVPEW